LSEDWLIVVTTSGKLFILKITKGKFKSIIEGQEVLKDVIDTIVVNEDKEVKCFILYKDKLIVYKCDRLKKLKKKEIETKGECIKLIKPSKDHSRLLLVSSIKANYFVICQMIIRSSFMTTKYSEPVKISLRNELNEQQIVYINTPLKFSNGLLLLIEQNRLFSLPLNTKEHEGLIEENKYEALLKTKNYQAICNEILLKSNKNYKHIIDFACSKLENIMKTLLPSKRNSILLYELQ